MPKLVICYGPPPRASEIPHWRCHLLASLSHSGARESSPQFVRAPASDRARGVASLADHFARAVSGREVDPRPRLVWNEQG